MTEAWTSSRPVTSSHGHLGSRASRGGHSLPGPPRDARDASRTAATATDRGRPCRVSLRPPLLTASRLAVTLPRDPFAELVIRQQASLRLAQRLELRLAGLAAFAADAEGDDFDRAA